MISRSYSFKQYIYGVRAAGRCCVKRRAASGFQPCVRGLGALVFDYWGDHHVVAGDGQFG